jgi:hypothetical protein
MKLIYIKIVILASTLIYLSHNVADANAQWVEQTITLDPGWNAIYLEVQPEPRQCDAVYANLPVESVWVWNPPYSTVQYIDIPPNPDSLTPGQAEWLVYFPPSRPEHIVSNLFTVRGGRAYLIKLAGDQPKTWSIIGHPCLPRIDWQADRYNLVGFHVSDGEAGPLLENYFLASPEHVDLSNHFYQPVYHLNNVTGHWEEVISPSTTRIEYGKSYWIYAQGTSEYTGPLQINVEQGDGIDFDSILVEQKVGIDNLSDNGMDINLLPVSSLEPTDPNYAPVAGDVPLLYMRDPNVWADFSESLLMALDAHETPTLSIAVNRSDPNMESSGVYQSILEVANGEGVRIQIPVRAENKNYTGLWVGTAMINTINEPADANDPNTPKPTATEFQFRLILHRDSYGQCKFLREVIQLWNEPTWKTDPETGYQVIDEPGRFVLLTDDSLVSEYTGSSLRDGQLRGRRISSAAFSFPEPLDMAGTIETGTLTGSFTITPEDSLNPFKHKYHPDHNNLDPQGGYVPEAYQVVRDMGLTFTDVDPATQLIPAGWGDTILGGIYHETITGLHQKPIFVEGIFRLHHISSVEVLNDGIN